LAGVMRGADLMGNRVLVLVPAKLRVYNASTGALVQTRPLPNVTSAGVCGMPPCPVAALQMLDAARGLVAYTLAGKLHLLRLRDGRNKVVAPAEDARFGSKGSSTPTRLRVPGSRGSGSSPGRRSPFAPKGSGRLGTCRRRVGRVFDVAAFETQQWSRSIDGNHGPLCAGAAHPELLRGEPPMQFEVVHVVPVGCAE
jgi:hypothetical protein